MSISQTNKPLVGRLSKPSFEQRYLDASPAKRRFLSLLHPFKTEKLLRAKITEIACHKYEDRAIFSSLPYTFFKIAADGNILEYIPGRNQTSSFSGTEKSEFVGRNIKDLLPEDTAREFMEKISSIMAGSNSSWG